MKDLKDINSFAKLRLYVKCPNCWYHIDFVGHTEDFPDVCNHKFGEEQYCTRTREELQALIDKYDEILNKK